MEISPAAELAHITYPLLADVASEEVEMKERLQFLVNLLHQYLHSFQRGKKKEKSFPLGQRISCRKVCCRHDIDRAEPHQESNNLQKLYDDRVTKTSTRDYFMPQKLLTAPKFIFIKSRDFLLCSKIRHLFYQ
jgi:hypothetical protein